MIKQGNFRNCESEWTQSNIRNTSWIQMAEIWIFFYTPGQTVVQNRKYKN